MPRPGHDASGVGPEAGRHRSVTVGVVLLATMLLLVAGFVHKSTCLSGEGFEAAYRNGCYNDIMPLYLERGLQRDAFPYLDAENEYPVLTGLFMWTASQIGRGEGGFFVANAAMLASLALVTSVLLFRLVGRRALYFALAPALALYGFLNWDLLVVALTTAATVAFLRRRDAAAGVLLGLGIAAKLYPLLLVVPFVLDRHREGDRRAAVRLSIATAATWALVNLPFMLLGFDRWREVFRFNAARGIHAATLWFVGCRAITGSLDCDHVELVNVLSLALFSVGAVLIWRAKVARDLDVPRWTLALPLLILFLLTTKVYSPQYSLWLVPWFALVLPDLRLFVAFEAADVAVFITEFAWLQRRSFGGGLPVWPLELAVIARAGVLVAVLVVYVTRPSAPGAALAQAASGSAGPRSSRTKMSPSSSE